MMQSEQINELAAALAKAQGVMGNAVMNRINPHFKSKYADMGSVLDAIRPPLSANGLAIVQPMQIMEGGLVLRTILMHSSGQYIAGEYPLPAASSQQAMGSALTYARRYSIAALVCNASDEDDDANAAGVPKEQTNSEEREIAQTKYESDISRARFIEECEASIERIAAHPDPLDLLRWWNSETEKIKRRDFGLLPAEVLYLKGLVTEKAKRIA